MKDRVSRRSVLSALGVLVCGAAGGAWAVPLERAARPIARPENMAKLVSGTPDGVIARANLSGLVSCAVVDMTSGQMLEGVDPDLPMPPASVAKALTALYALDVLGPSFTFETRLLATAPIKNGILRGDLILAGGGDPELDTNDLAAMAAALKEAGLREIRGKFIVNDGALARVQTIDPGQLDHVGYSPAVAGIALNFNRVHFEWRRTGGAYAVTMDARSDRYRPRVAMAQMEVRARAAPIYTYADGGRVDRWTVARSALGNGGARWLPVRKPALYAGDVFQTLARSQGIVLPNPQVSQARPKGEVLVVHQSRALSRILRDMLKYSTNLTAEMVGMTATTQSGSKPRDLAASGAAMSRWAEATLGMSGTAMVDHSGLGEASRMTARGLALALARLGRSDALRPLLKSFTMRDGQGRLLKDHPVDVIAKTGTLNFVSCLGGYALPPKGPDLAFAIFTANLDRRAALSRAESERPPGARSWNSRSRRLQSALIDRWGRVYGV